MNTHALDHLRDHRADAVVRVLVGFLGDVTAEDKLHRVRLSALEDGNMSARNLEELGDHRFDFLGVVRRRHVVQHCLLKVLDKLRNVPASRLDAANLDVAVFVPSDVPVGRGDCRVLFGGGEEDPVVNSLQRDVDTDTLSDFPAELFVVLCCCPFFLDPDAVNDGVEEMVAVRFGNFLCREDDIAGEGVDRLVRFDPAKPRVLVPEIPETAHQHPFECVLAAIEFSVERLVLSFILLLHFLVVRPLLHNSPEGFRNNPFSLLADRVLKLGHFEVVVHAVGRTAVAVDGFRRNIPIHHDGRIHRDEIEFGNVFVVPKRRIENQPTPVGHQERGRRFEFFRLPFLRRDENTVLARPRQLHR